MVNLNENDVAFLQALVDCDGEATVTDIRKRTEERNDIPELEGSHINYRCKNKFSTEDSNETGWVKVKAGGVTENGKDKPKRIHIVNGDAIHSALKNNQELYTQDYDTLDEKVYQNEGDIQELKRIFKQRENTLQQEISNKDEEITQLRNKMNRALGVTLKVMGASDDDIQQVKQVLKEEEDTEKSVA